MADGGSRSADYRVTENTPSGSCNLQIVGGLFEEFHFTVIATAFNDNTGGSARWIRVPALNRPLVALFLSYYVMASTRSALTKRRRSFDLTQSVEGNMVGGVCRLR